MKTSRLIGTITPLLLTAGTLAAAEKLYTVAFKRINYVPDANDVGDEMRKYAPLYFEHVDWVKAQPGLDVWHLTTPDDAHISALWIPHANSKKAVIIGHGYKGTGITMSNYAHMFYDLGFNVLMPDDRGHGDSDGDYISFGWLDRLDYLQWLDKIIAELGTDSELLLFGTSMGGATVSLVAGEPTIPTQVKAIVADCSYTSLDDELSYLIRKLYHLPRNPIVPMASFINYRRLGYPLKVVNVTKALTHNRRPLFVIHGAADDYVPTWMAQRNYAASTGPKDLWIVPDAIHAESYWINPERYQQRVSDFIAPYFKE